MVIGSHRVDSFPHREAWRRAARKTLSGAGSPVVISPLGDEFRDMERSNP